MDVRDAGVARLWMVLICLFGGNGKSARESEWNERLKELLDGRKRGRTAMKGGKRASVLNYWLHIYMYSHPSVMRCILHLQLNRLRQDYPSVGHIAETLRQKNIQIIFAVTEEVTHLYEVQQSLYSFNIQPFIQKCIHCFQYISPGTLQLWAPQLHLHCSVWKGFHGGFTTYNVASELYSLHRLPICK